MEDVEKTSQSESGVVDGSVEVALGYGDSAGSDDVDELAVARRDLELVLGEVVGIEDVVDAGEIKAKAMECLDFDLDVVADEDC